MKLPTPPRRRSRLNFERLEDRTNPTSSTVTTFLDVVNPNDGVISLREAIAAAESDPEADTIDFAADLAGATITLNQFDSGLDSGEAGPSAFNITTPITILGQGQRIQRDVETGNFRHFFVTSTGALTLESVGLSNGRAIGGSGASGGGGAAGLGGSIFNMGRLIVRNSTFSANMAQGGNGSLYNEIAGGGGGIGAGSEGPDGGGPNGGLINEGGAGDGGFGGGGSADLSFGSGGSGGFGGGGGAGIFGGDGGFGGGGGGGTGNGEGSGGTAGFGGLDGDAFGNAGGGGGFGGAIFNYATSGATGIVTLVNTTITDNTAIGGIDGAEETRAAGLGGGVFNLNGTVRITNSTLVANFADVGGSLYNASHDATAGVSSQEITQALLINSIFEDSVLTGGRGASADEIHNVVIVNPESSAGAFLARISGGPNITNGGGLVNENGTNDTFGLITETGSAIVNPLADNGGAVRTLALASDSSAVDAGDDESAYDPETDDELSTDARGLGFSRFSGTVDLGAFEFQKAAPLPIVSVVATSPTSDETGTNLQIEFTRTGDTSQALVLTVAFTLNGYTPGVDAGTQIVSGGSLTGSDISAVVLTFDAGSSTVTATLPVLDDIHAEADESVTVTIPEQSGITVGQPNSATVTIVANDFVVINTNDSGEGTLRQAILNAESIPGADTVTFIEALEGATIPLTSFNQTVAGPSAFVISTDVTIQGSGQILTRDGEASDFRHFYVDFNGETSGTLTLENLEIQNGLARGGDGAGGGGGAAGLGGAIFNRGSLVIRNTTFVGNSAVGGGVDAETGGGGGGGLGGDGQPGPNGSGGGINGGSGGFEGVGGDGGFGGGGGGDSDTLGGITGGDGGFGGGGGGTSAGFGGNGGFGGGGGASLSSGTPGFGVLDAGYEFNEAGAGFGGAIFSLEGDVVILNSTFTNNTARGGSNPSLEGTFAQPGYGGGLFNLNGHVDITNSTFAGNRADLGGSLYNLAAFEEGNEFPHAHIDLFNSIFVDSVLPNGSGDDSENEVHNRQGFGSEGSEVGALLHAGSPNITNGGGFVNEGGVDFDASGVIAATAPVVSGTLADNGGLVRTLRLLPGSEAIDAGNNDDAVDPTSGDGGEPLEFDQRGPGFSRILPFEGTVDLGAYEATVLGVPETIVITTPDFVIVQNPPEGGPDVADPFPDFFGENLVAVGDVNNDGIVDYVFSAGNFGGPRVQVLSGADNTTVLFNFFAYDMDFRGGTYVACGDLDGDGYADIVTGAGFLGGPHVRAFSGRDGSVLVNFMAFDSSHRSGVTVALGDVNGDGTLDIITGSGPGDGSEVRVFDGSNLALLHSLLPYGEGYTEGVFVAAGNLDGDNRADIVVGPLSNSSTTQTVVYAGVPLSKANTFFEDEPSLFVGIRFTIADANGDGLDDLIVVAARGGGPRRIVVNPLTGEQVDNSFFDDEDIRTEGYGVGA